MIKILLNIILIIDIALFVFSLAVISKRYRQSKAIRRFFFSTFFGLLWVLSVTVMDEANTVEIYNIFIRVNFSIAPLVAGFIALFSIHYPNENKKFSIQKELLFVSPLVLLSILSYTNLFIEPAGLREIQIKDFYLIYISLLVFYFIGVASYNLVHKFIKSLGLQRLRLKYILIGYMITIVTELAESIYQNISGIFQMELSRGSTIVTLFFPLLTIYALFRYRLFDIKLVIRRGVVRAVSFIIIFGVYLFAILSFKQAIDIQNENSQTLFLVIATLLVVATIEPIRKLVHNIVDSTFEKRDQKKEEIQKKVEFAFRSQQNVSNLIQSVSEFIETSFDIEKVVFLEKGNTFFNDKKEAYNFLQGIGRILIPEELPYRQEESERYFFISKELEHVEESAYLSIGQGDLFMGIFALGKRKNNKAYTVEEVRELKRLQDDFTEALLNARLYQQAVERIKV